ncbi:MAG: DUF349 domain-containing protein [Burkholderiaceae bacterium]|nr:DUF349 domain-containing protein [Burkholderiaceae bacterium]
MLTTLFKKNPDPSTETMQNEQPDYAPSHDKELALNQANALSGEEAAAAEFILQCQFADARLIAAQHLHSKDVLERVLPAMRNADRRVAKLIQGKLDALMAEQQGREQAQLCIARAEALAAEQQLLANQVVDLDHAWALVKNPPQEMQTAYDAVRATLAARLARQADLQHEVLVRTMHLRELAHGASVMEAAELTDLLDRTEREVAKIFAEQEAASLPKHLLTDFTALHAQCKAVAATLDQAREAMQTREALLHQWEAGHDLKPEALKAQWAAAPAIAQDGAGQLLQQRFEALLAGVAEAQESVRQEARAARESIGEVLDALEKAVQEGVVRTAIELEKQAHAHEARKLPISSGDAARLTRLRGELRKLQGWAKWGGNISREELLKAAEEMPGKNLPVTELAKKVGDLRERWKALDQSAGPSAKELWERFDAACTTAYAPAAAHFKKLGEERQANLQAAEALLTQIRQFAQGQDLQAGESDWKALSAFCTRTAQSWHRLGVVERKEKKRLDREYEQAMKALQAPLAAQQEQEAVQRQALIAEVQALVPAERATLDKVKALQERWQQRAKALPLERKQEQALWQQFRAACDALFAARKEHAAGADAERKEHLAAKEALCAALEAATGETAGAIGKLLRETRERWAKAGHVPRAQEQRIEARYAAAVGALNKRLDQIKREAAQAEQGALQEKMRLCLAVEQALAEGKEDAPATAEQWQAVPALSGETERILKKRFDSGLAALQKKDAGYAAQLEKNRATLLQNLLRFEIVAGLDSPPELSRERLQMQVAVLQSTLKNGASGNRQEALLELCRLPALADAAAAKRLNTLLGRLRHAA